MSSEHHAPELVVQQDGALVQATMNRPAALNALSLEMIRLLSAGLAAWGEDPQVRAVLLDGAGDRAFCAGGDIKSAYRTGMAWRRGEVDEGVLPLFFEEEYALNRRLFHFSKPIVAFMDGIVMGGGFGIAGPCRFRIAAETTRFAMPETGIGFFPDVGSLYFLHRAPAGVGAYLALTGRTVGPADALFCGAATHYVPVAMQLDCRTALRAAAAENDATSAMAAVLETFHVVPEEPGSLVRHATEAASCFSGETVADILERLRTTGSDWAQETADILACRSPTSLHVTLEHFHRTQAAPFDEISAQDYTLACHFLRGHDFYEGIRAALIDRDGQPRWDPPALDTVPHESVLAYFTPPIPKPGGGV